MPLSPRSRSVPAGRDKPCPALGVMLVDDETAYIDLLEQLLTEHLACPVFCFKRPADALDALPGLNVELIVTDFHMPHMNGFEFLLEVKKRRPRLQSIMITGHPVELTPEWAERLPLLRAVIRKPFKWTVLAVEISKHWTGSSPPFPP
jgi:DNA-binding NtrC family response regulator